MASVYCVLVLLIISVVTVVGGSSPPMMVEDHGSGDVMMTYEDWVNSEEINLKAARHSRHCYIFSILQLWPPPEKETKLTRNQRSLCIGILLTRHRPVMWGKQAAESIRRIRLPSRSRLETLMKFPSFWRNHTLIYQHIVKPARFNDGYDAYPTYQEWVDSEKNVMFDRREGEFRQPLAYEKCIMLEFADKWDDDSDINQRVHRVACNSTVREAHKSWKSSGISWPPNEFLEALVKVPSFWKDHKKIYNHIIRPAHLYNYFLHTTS